MQNWWIAAFEHAGIWTREQAEHVSEHIKHSIGRDKYPDAVRELAGILSSGNFGTGSITNVESDITALRNRIEALEAAAKKDTKSTVAKEIKA